MKDQKVLSLNETFTDITEFSARFESLRKDGWGEDGRDLIQSRGGGPIMWSSSFIKDPDVTHGINIWRYRHKGKCKCHGYVRCDDLMDFAELTYKGPVEDVARLLNYSDSVVKELKNRYDP